MPPALTDPDENMDKQAAGQSGAKTTCHRALFGVGRADSFRARFQVHVDLHRRQRELSGRHRSNNRVRGILFFLFTRIIIIISRSRI
eukprot:scaffold9322_cov120-Isochrysis_galbana.AAC.2